MLYLSSSCFRENKITDILKKAIESDIYNIELSGGVIFSEGLAEQLIEYQAEYDLNYLVHNYFPPPKNSFILNIASVDNNHRKKSVEFAKRSIELSSKTGGSIYTIHSGYLVDLHLSEDGEHFIQDGNKLNNKERVIDNFVQSVDELCTYASKFNVKFGVENLFPVNSKQNFSLMCLLDEIESALDTFSKYQNFGILLDLGHAQLSSNLLNFDLDQFLKDLVLDHSEKIFQIHISDNDGYTDLHILPQKDSWMDRFVFDFDLRGIPITIEARGSQIDDVINYYHYFQKKFRC